MSKLQGPLSCVLLSCLLALAQPAAAEEGRSISLKECVLTALQQSFNLKIEVLDQEIAAAQLKVAKSDYEPVLSASLDYNDTTSIGGIDVRTGQFVGSETQSVRASATVSGLLPTGGSYSLGASINDVNGARGSTEFSDASGRGPFIQIRQPLLQNLKIDNTRLNIRVSMQNLRISELDIRQAMMDTVSRVETAYYDLVAARENVRVQESALQLAEQLFSENQKRVALGALAPIDESEARSQVATSRGSLLSAQRLAAASQNVLKGAMVNDFAQWQGLTLSPSSALATAPTTFDFKTSWTTALQRRPDLQSLQIQLEQSQLIAERRKNELLPELDLTATAGLTGSNSTLRGVREQLRDRDAPFYSIGLSLVLPLGNRRDRENHRIAQAQIAQARVRLTQFRQNVMIQIDDAVNQARTDFQRLSATKEAREFAEQALANEQGKLARGVSTNFVVLQLQRNVTAARSNEIQSITDYSKSLARLRMLEGSNLAAHQVDLQFK